MYKVKLNTNIILQLQDLIAKKCLKVHWGTESDWLDTSHWHCLLTAKPGTKYTRTTSSIATWACRATWDSVQKYLIKLFKHIQTPVYWKKKQKEMKIVVNRTDLDNYLSAMLNDLGDTTEDHRDAYVNDNLDATGKSLHSLYKQIQNEIKEDILDNNILFKTRTKKEREHTVFIVESYITTFSLPHHHIHYAQSLTATYLPLMTELVLPFSFFIDIVVPHALKIS